jgi:hypothetical protein
MAFLFKILLVFTKLAFCITLVCKKNFNFFPKNCENRRKLSS